MKKNYSVSFKIAPRSGKGASRKETKTFFAISQDRATKLAEYFKYTIYDMSKYKVSVESVKKLK